MAAHPARTDLENDPAFWADLKNPQLTRDSLCRKWGASAGFISSRRALVRVEQEASPSAEILPEARSEDSSGNISISKVADRIIPLSEWLDDLRADGYDPDDFTTSHSHSVWTQHTRAQVTKILYANKFSATRKPQSYREALVAHDVVMDAIKNFHYIPSERAFQKTGFVLVPTDLQTGKVDIAGGTAETAAQVLTSFARAAEILKEERPAQVAMVDAGDIIENIYNTSSQLATNDRDLPHQIVEAMFLMQQGIQMLAPHTQSLRYAAVSSNHGAARVAPKQPAGDAHADYGLAVAKILGNALTLNPAAFAHVTVQTPEPYMESLAFEIAGSKIGVVHGHQTASPDKISDWWKGQALGRLPVSDADILVVGHWHSLRYQQTGDARHIFVGPSSDRGSSWFSNIKGDQATSGMLSFFTQNGEWADLRVL